MVVQQMLQCNPSSPLNEEKAIKAAADLLGELFAFMVAGGAVVFEVQPSSKSEARKEQLRKHELEEMMRQRDVELAGEVEELKHRMAQLEQLTKEISPVFNSKLADNRQKDA